MISHCYLSLLLVGCCLQISLSQNANGTWPRDCSPCEDRRGCYFRHEVCDGQRQCQDGSDENDCAPDSDPVYSGPWFYGSFFLCLLMIFVVAMTYSRKQKERLRLRAARCRGRITIPGGRFPSHPRGLASILPVTSPQRSGLTCLDSEHDGSFFNPAMAGQGPPFVNPMMAVPPPYEAATSPTACALPPYSPQASVSEAKVDPEESPPPYESVVTESGINDSAAA